MLLYVRLSLPFCLPLQTVSVFWASLPLCRAYFYPLPKSTCIWNCTGRDFVWGHPSSLAVPRDGICHCWAVQNQLARTGTETLTRAPHPGVLIHDPHQPRPRLPGGSLTQYRAVGVLLGLGMSQRPTKILETQKEKYELQIAKRSASQKVVKWDKMSTKDNMMSAATRLSSWITEAHLLSRGCGYI